MLAEKTQKILRLLILRDDVISIVIFTLSHLLPLVHKPPNLTKKMPPKRRLLQALPENSDKDKNHCPMSSKNTSPETKNTTEETAGFFEG